MAGLALRHPRTVALLFGAAWRFRARGWYRRAPFLPLPPRSYLAWRLETAFGDENRAPERGELERYLRWAAWMRAARRHKT